MHYLDFAASAPLRPEAARVYGDAAALLGNPASIHSLGQQAKLRVEEAREQVAGTLGADAVELVFTGSGSEAVNLAIKGLFWQRNPGGERPVIVLPEGEHHATLDAVEWLERTSGAELVWVGLDWNGHIRLDEWRAALAEHAGRIALATALWANNEIGTVNDGAALASACANAGVPLHLDAIAAYGHETIDFAGLRQATGSTDVGLVAVSVSAHKIGGPQSVGGLVVARRATLESLVHGGGQQRKLHSGTEDVLGALAFAAAATAMQANFAAENEAQRALRDRLLAALDASKLQVRINGDRQQRLSNNVHVTFEGCESDSLLFLLDHAGVAVSTGSACQAGVTEVSHVVRALGYSETEARGSLRFTLGWSSTDADVDALLAALPEAVERARAAGLAARTTRFD